MEMTTTRDSEILICSIAGELDMYESPGMHARYLSLTSASPDLHVILDFAKATYIDSSGIGVLFQILTDAKRRKRELCVCNTVGMVEKLFALSRIASILPVEKNLQAAIGRVRGHS
jgi:anti-anti-sigma factor